MAKLLSLPDRLLLGQALLGDVFEDLADAGGLMSFSYKQVYGFVPQRYQRRYFVQTLSRKFKTGEMKKVIRNGKAYLCLTRRGQEKVERLFPYQRFQNRGWDGKWLIVVFDIPEKRKRDRNILRNKLYELGFGRLQRSVFISPFNVYEDLVEFLESWGLSKQALVIESKKLWMEDEKEMVEQIWKIDKINKAYEKLIEEAEVKEVEVKEWIDRYFEVLISDPFLPRQLLPPDWAGDKARKIFGKMVRKVRRN